MGRRPAVLQPKATRLLPRPGASWLHTCQSANELHQDVRVCPQLVRARTLRQASLESCCGYSALNSKSRRRRMGAPEQQEVEQATAEHIVARGCAHAHIHGRGRARRGSSKASAIACGHPTARLTGGVNHTNLTVWKRRAFLGGVNFLIAPAGQTTAWGRLVGHHRLQKRS